jgi:hypothetical protein
MSSVFSLGCGVHSLGLSDDVKLKIRRISTFIGKQNFDFQFSLGVRKRIEPKKWKKMEKKGTIHASEINFNNLFS